MQHPVPQLWRPFSLRGSRSALRALTAVAAACGLCAWAAMPPPPDSRPPVDGLAWFDPIIDVQQLLLTSYVDEPDMHALQRAAIEGMLDELGDPFTEFFAPEDITAFDKSVRGNYVGIGAQVRLSPAGWLTIATPLDGSPALGAGLLAGDEIRSIDGTSTRGLSVQGCVDLLTGVPGTDVRLVVHRAQADAAAAIAIPPVDPSPDAPGVARQAGADPSADPSGRTFEVAVPRGAIRTRSVYGVARDGPAWRYTLDPAGALGYVRLTQFTERTAAELKQVLTDLDAAGVRGLVLDLRYNPGGLLASAVAVSDMFLDDGRIVSSRGRAFPEEVHDATPGVVLAGVPLLVLVNGQSASASEIVAGALSDHNRAVVLGERTFGKGSVQRVEPLSAGGGQLKLTERLYYLPSGRSIHRLDASEAWGIDPSPGFYVPMTRAAQLDAVQNQRARERITSVASTGSVWPPAPASADLPSWIADELADAQLAAAARVLQQRLGTGAWVRLQDAEANTTDLAVDELLELQEARARLERELARLDRRVAAASSGVDATKADRRTILPDGAALAGGRLDVYNADGSLVRSLEITDDRLEVWLTGAPLAPVPADNTTDTATPPGQ